MSAPSAERVESSASLSSDGRYRYTLRRVWGGGLWLTFVMLNPSTADASQDDPTIRRCCGFARTLGYDGIHVVNLYAYRATRPQDLWTVDDPVGPENDTALRVALGRPGLVIAAWGANARLDRVRQVAAMPGSNRLLCLGITKNGAPRHPLYLRADSEPVPWVAVVGGKP
ncbi:MULTISPECIES: DUF1643 domain-containing protein [unclassified Rhodococcus (in: high G+C Gram-positive bacteria)]|uniref:DUF1643 domain-containing protein n=1 Tax=unclassified Rhodococcus (in: high G+C Gram-positive bacteria) TaxID=192944 RepID=UPI000B9B9A50|nr:hypothetical protein CH259_16730 [Rhodococcus sp. 05-2254-4]OZE48098.1 hypothetical protein CH261_09325 [Rhodococcus sp. 05-2254-3]OZE49309.1 hypothetical protein CH283_17110 [Rhodococcus sp. 05-2254-2]